MTTDPDTIVSLAANGMSVRDIATAHGMTEATVTAIIDQETAHPTPPGLRVRTTAVRRIKPSADFPWQATLDFRSGPWCFGGEHLRQQWLLEARRLEALGTKYYEQAMEVTACWSS